MRNKARIVVQIGTREKYQLGKDFGNSGDPHIVSCHYHH